MSAPGRRSFKQTVALAKQAERGAPAGSPPPSGADADTPAAPRRPAIPPSELGRRRDEIAGRFAEAHWDLGGIAYEMAIRDHFRLDTLQRQAARVQELDAELAQVERLQLLERDGAAGTCSNCAAPYGRGASFCWRCGAGLQDTLVAR
jgi:hypothetical protein